MGLLDALFSRNAACPHCGSPEARKSFGTVRCPQAGCPNFDPELQRSKMPGGSRQLGRDEVEVRYRNYNEEEKTFVAVRKDARRKRNHLILRLKPKKQPISLNRDRIRNLEEVERWMEG